MLRRRIVLLPALLLSFGLPVAGRAAGVVVAEATRISFPLTVEAVGTARADESVEIRPKVSETVRRIAFEEGQTVRAGDVLVELDRAEALALVAEAKAALVDAESRFRRAQELFKSELTSASDLETLEARRDASRAALDAAEARLAESVVRAPFSGRVGLRRVSLGALVGPSVVITTLDDTDPVKVDFDVPETALGRLGSGLPVEAHTAAWPDTTFHGTVASIDTRVDPVSRTVTVRARVANPEGLLRPGMFLTVKLLHRDVTALVVPEQAIVPEQSEQFVLVVGDGNTVEKRRVTTGRRRPGQVEIVRGLQEGELVIAEGTQKARPGDTVEIVGR
ncbi:MAG TPA: efflux RND transporter periplasmic adaptor subunit, partial [bacterium]|nr:efflux RND transporter periplasmic adaptor subunit [bacterium]